MQICQIVCLTNATELRYHGGMKKNAVYKIDGILSEMREKGFRKSRSREGILRTLAMSKNPLSVAMILDALKKEKAPFNKTTIYREIAFLVRLGHIKELQIRNGGALYEMDMSHHHHLVCTGCGEVRHIDLKDSLCREEGRLAKEEKFIIREHVLEFFGVCCKCQ